MSDPKDKIAAWMREKFEVSIWSTVNITVGDSPIENALFIALEAFLRVHCLPLAMRRCGGEWGSPESVFERIGSRPADYINTVFLFETQAQIEGYRVDFVFHQRSDDEQSIESLVVECDGHDFHERTKFQAMADRSRDRRLQELGYTVYRFTGAEIYHDPMKCADQVLRWVKCSETL